MHYRPSWPPAAIKQRLFASTSASMIAFQDPAAPPSMVTAPSDLEIAIEQGSTPWRRSGAAPREMGKLLFLWDELGDERRGTGIRRWPLTSVGDAGVCLRTVRCLMSNSRSSNSSCLV